MNLLTHPHPLAVYKTTCSPAWFYQVPSALSVSNTRSVLGFGPLLCLCSSLGLPRSSPASLCLSLSTPEVRESCIPAAQKRAKCQAYVLINTCLWLWWQPAREGDWSGADSQNIFPGGFCLTSNQIKKTKQHKTNKQINKTCEFPHLTRFVIHPGEYSHTLKMWWTESLF